MSAMRCVRQASRERNRTAVLAIFSRWSASNNWQIVPLAGSQVASSSDFALARALARNPEILLLDEPTASFDPAATKAIEDIIRAVGQRGIKVVMATHDLGEARRLGGEIVLLHRGRAIESGPASSFFNTPRSGEARTFLAGELLV